jgi:hypothetical protein
MNYIRQVESLETRYSNHQDVKETSNIQITAEQYNERLEKIINVLADLKFNGIKSKLVNINDKMTNNEKLKAYQAVYTKYMNEYINLVKSLYNTNNPVIFKEGDYSISSTDLLSYLQIYNLTGGYQLFKEHHKTGKVGNEAVSKELYAAGLDRIEGLITSFKTLSSDLIKSRGGKIIITSQNSKKEDIKFELDEKMVEFYRMITKKQQQKTM